MPSVCPRNIYPSKRRTQVGLQGRHVAHVLHGAGSLVRLDCRLWSPAHYIVEDIEVVTLRSLRAHDEIVEVLVLASGEVVQVEELVGDIVNRPFHTGERDVVLAVAAPTVRPELVAGDEIVVP